MSVQKDRPANISHLRAGCAEVLHAVLDEGISLSVALPKWQKPAHAQDNALMQEICFGVLRVMPELDFYLHQLMNKVLTGKNRVLHYLLLVGLYQLCYTRVPPHAAVSETVAAVAALKKPGFKNLVNGVLRSFQRQQIELVAAFQQQPNMSLHPAWLRQKLQQAYPAVWSDIIAANNQKPPMWLRVNQRRCSITQYRQLLAVQGIEAQSALHAPSALCLVEPVGVNQLPHFAEGWVSVQDLSAQYAAELLAPLAGEQILDLCAAPGGKTTHILEIAPTAKVMAVDIEANRLKRVQENLTRLQQSAEIVLGDACYPERWATGRQFDRILLDAPCSATGVIRRHPDIKWLRREADIAALAQLQRQILMAIWPYLKPGGILVYATCSVMPEENYLQVEQFLQSTPDAQLSGPLEQKLPAPHAGDGFFYAKLQKRVDAK